MRCDLDVLHQCVKRVKAKSQKVLGANFCVCRCYRGKTGKGRRLFSLPLLLPYPERVKVPTCNMGTHISYQASQYTQLLSDWEPILHVCPGRKNSILTSWQFVFNIQFSIGFGNSDQMTFEGRTCGAKNISVLIKYVSVTCINAISAIYNKLRYFI